MSWCRGRNLDILHDEKEQDVPGAPAATTALEQIASHHTPDWRPLELEEERRDECMEEGRGEDLFAIQRPEKSTRIISRGV